MSTTMKTMLAACCAGVLCAAPIAQSPATATPPTLAVPDDTRWVVRVAGPQVLAEHFAKTKFAAMLTTERMQKTWRDTRSELEPQLGLAQEQIAAFDEVAKALASLRGQLWIAGGFDMTSLAKEDEAQVWHLAVLDGVTEEQHVACREALAALLPDERVVERELAGQTARFVQTPIGELLLPLRREDRLVVALGAHLQERLTRFFADERTTRWSGEIAERPIAVRIDTGAMLRDFLALADAGDVQAPAWMAKALRFSGLTAVERFGLSAYAIDDLLAQDVRVDLGAGPKGLLDVLVPTPRGLPAALRFLPAAATNFSAMAVDVPGLERQLLAVFAEFADELPLRLEDLEGQFTEFTKLRLREDLLRAFDGTYLRIDTLYDLDPFEEFESDDAERANERVGDACHVVGLVDGARFAKDLEGLLRSRGLHAGRKTEQYGEQRIHRLNVLGMQFEYAIVGNALALGIGGEATQKNLRAVLDRLTDTNATTPQLSKTVQARLQQLPADLNQLEAVSLVETLDGLLQMFDAIAGELANYDATLEDDYPGIQVVPPLLRTLLAEIRRVGIDESVTGAWRDGDRIVQRTLW